MKTAMVVDKDKLQDAIRKAEADGPLSGLVLLWKKAAEIYNAEVPGAAITHSVVYLRAVEWQLEYKTQSGKKGRSGPMTEEQKAAMAAARAGMVRRSRKDKMASLPGAEKHFNTLRKITPKTLHGLVDKVEKGSLTAAIKLMCIECMGFEKRNVWDCRGYTCPMYLHRPYQKSDDSEKDVPGTETDIEKEEVE